MALDPNDPNADTSIMTQAVSPPANSPMLLAANAANTANDPNPSAISDLTPLQQEVIRQGVARGHNEHEISGLVGQTGVENNGQTTGTPGDNGTAFGGFQWRNDRADALKKKADAAGVDWADPGIQGTHAWDEYEKRGHKASNLQEGLNAGIAFEVPHGFVPGADSQTGVDSYGRRAADTLAMYPKVAAFMGKPVDPTQTVENPGKPSALAYNETNDAAPGSPAIGAIGRVLSGGSPASAQPVPSAGVNPNAPQQPGGNQALGNVGNSLMGLSAALLARDNPGAAGVMKGLMAPAPAKNNLSDGGHVNIGGQWFQKNFNPATGQSTLTPTQPTSDDLNTEQTNVLTIAQAQQKLKDAKDKAETDATVPRGVDKAFGDNVAKVAPLGNAIDNLDKTLTEGTAKGYDISPVELLKSKARVYTNQATDYDRWLGRVQSGYATAAAARMKAEGGSPSNARLKQAGLQDSPNGAEFNGDMTMDALKRHRDSLASVYGDIANTNTGYASSYPSIGKRPAPPGSPDGETMATHYPRMTQEMQTRGKQLDEAIQAYHNRGSANPQSSTSPAPSFDLRNSTNPHDDYARLPKGTSYVDPNGVSKIKQ